MEEREGTAPTRAHARGKTRLTAERKRIFLEHLARSGIVAEAARVASPHSMHGAISTFRKERGRDHEFAQAWDEALDHAVGVLEAEAFRRAVEGWDEPTRFGPVRKHSDRLLELMLKARSPRYHERRRYEVDAKSTVRSEPLDLDQLSPRQQALLEELLEGEPPSHAGGPAGAIDVTPNRLETSDRRAAGSVPRVPPEGER